MAENDKIIGQKWVVRRKEKDGKFKHISTFEFEPFEKDLLKLGNGEYSIMTTKPSFKFCKKIIIRETVKNDNLPQIQKISQDIKQPISQLQQKQQINANQIIKTEIKNSQPKTNLQQHQQLKQHSQSTSQQNTQKPQQPIQATQIKHSPSLQRNTQIIPQKTKSIIQSNKPILQRKQISSKTHSNIVKKETNNFQRREKQYVIKKVIPNEDGKKELTDIADVYTKKPTKKDIEQYIEVYGSGKYYIINKETNKTEDIIKIKEETKNLIEEYNMCSECGKRLKISNSRNCKFCENIYCKNCNNEHECEYSFVCYYCGKREEYGLEEIAEYCRNIFCSPKCLEKCFIRNGNKKDCENCELNENYEDEIPITCEECGCEFTITEDEVDEIIVCPECETELEI